MADQWYYSLNQQQHGPVTWAELQHMAVAGTLPPTELVWTQGMHQWLPAADQRGLFPDAPEPAAAAPESAAPVPTPPAPHDAHLPGPTAVPRRPAVSPRRAAPAGMS